MGSGSTPLAAHAFRREYAKLVSILAREFGVHRLELVEDAVQDALVAALRGWPKSGTPQDPSAWLYRVAKNRLLDQLRRPHARATSLDEALEGDASIASSSSNEPTEPHATFEHEIADDELRMLFVCVDESIPVESQLVIALKVLCGFSTKEIALRLLTSEENVQKRLSRARERLRTLDPSLDTPTPDLLEARRASVLRVVYLLFNEGYSSTLADRLIRRELCDEAIRLGHLLADHPACSSAEGDALLALMYLHAARFDARVDGNGGLLLLEDQDRSLWDRRAIQLGLHFLERSARGDTFSRYHAEAAVAVEHCVAPTYAETRWSEIVQLYSMLEKIAPSPLHTLNRAIALAEWKGPGEALAVLHELKPPTWLLGYYLWDATLGELERRAGNHERALAHLERALAAARILRSARCSNDGCAPASALEVTRVSWIALERAPPQLTPLREPRLPAAARGWARAGEGFVFHEAKRGCPRFVRLRAHSLERSDHESRLSRSRRPCRTPQCQTPNAKRPPLRGVKAFLSREHAPAKSRHVALRSR